MSGLGTGTRLADLELTAVEVRLNRGVQERRDGRTRVRRVRAHVEVGVTEGLADRVDAVVVGGRQEVLARQVAEADGVRGGPRRTQTALREELLGGEDRLRIRLLSARVTALRRQGGSLVTALRMRVHDGGSRRIVRERSLRLHAANLHALSEELRAAVGIHNGNEDNDSGDYSTEANEAVLG